VHEGRVAAPLVETLRGVVAVHGPDEDVGHAGGDQAPLNCFHESGAETAAALAGEHGIEAEVVDLRTLNPLDINTVIASVRKTGKVIVLAQSCRTGSFTGEIASRIQELAFDHLDAPVQRIGAKDSPPPMSPTLEEAFLPQAADVVRVALDLVKHRC
jgi:pyruvate/2-oxoglutarate/acetoin dehydrogenase E1 component